MRGSRVRVAVVFLTGALLLGACGDDTDKATVTGPVADEAVENEERPEWDSLRRCGRRGFCDDVHGRW